MNKKTWLRILSLVLAGTCLLWGGCAPAPEDEASDPASSAVSDTSTDTSSQDTTYTSQDAASSTTQTNGDASDDSSSTADTSSADSSADTAGKPESDSTAEPEDSASDSTTTKNPGGTTTTTTKKPGSTTTTTTKKPGSMTTTTTTTTTTTSDTRPSNGGGTEDNVTIIEGTKKGITASKYGGGSSAHLQKLEALGASWYYNWGVNAPTASTSMEFVPMMWSGGTVNDHLSSIKAGCDSGKYKHVLGFNEPDNGDGLGSSMSVDTAIEYWGRMQVLNARLGSPSPMYPQNYTSGWLKEFMTKCEQKGYRVDFIAVHCYQEVGSKSTDTLVKELKDLVTSVYETYKLPVWVTEYGTIDNANSPTYTEAKATEVMKACTEMLEDLGFVERYSFFVDDFGGYMPPSGKYTRLYTNDQLNAMGKAYAAIETHTPMWIETETLPDMQVGKSYSATVKATGGKAPYTFSATGLPAGLSINASTGAISGTPSGSGSARITVTDKDGQAISRMYRLVDNTVGPAAYDKTGFKAYYAEFLNADPWFTDHEVSAVVDGKVDTSYTLPRAQAANDGVYVVFPSKLAVDQLKLVGTSASALPQQYKLLVWTDSNSWEEHSYTASVDGSTLTLNLDDTVNTSRVFVQLTGNASQNWSIAEWDVYAY